MLLACLDYIPQSIALDELELLLSRHMIHNGEQNTILSHVRRTIVVCGLRSADGRTWLRYNLVVTMIMAVAIYRNRNRVTALTCVLESEIAKGTWIFITSVPHGYIHNRTGSHVYQVVGC